TVRRGDPGENRRATRGPQAQGFRRGGSHPQGAGGGRRDPGRRAERHDLAAQVRGDGMADVIIEKKGAVTTATINRPAARNALSDEMVKLLDGMFTEGEHDPSTRCFVIRGAGEHFMAGGDVKKFYANRVKPAAERRADTEWGVHQLHLLAYKMRRV